MTRSPSASEIIEQAEVNVRFAADHLRNVADYLLAQNKIDSQEHHAIDNAVDGVHEALDMGRY